MRVQQNELIEARPKKLTEHTMPTPSEKLAESLEILAKLQRKYGAAIRAKDISRTHRDRLLTNGFLLRVMNGWLIPSRPDDVGVSPIRSKAEDERSEGLHKRTAPGQRPQQVWFPHSCALAHRTYRVALRQEQAAEVGAENAPAVEAREESSFRLHPEISSENRCFLGFRTAAIANPTETPKDRNGRVTLSQVRLRFKVRFL